MTDPIQPIQIERYVFPVTLSDGSCHNLVGYLYFHGDPCEKLLQVAVHGATYNHRYWDAPTINGHSYSYASYMAAQRFAVLALDLLGTGESDKPDGDSLTLAEAAHTVHQILQGLRHGSVLGRSYRRIVLVGHSNGSLTSIYVQGVYQDADALVVTGWKHAPHALPLPPEAATAMMKTPYVRIRGAVRSSLFYHLPAADPAVVCYDDECLADEIARGQFKDLLPVLMGDAGRSCSVNVKVPVLLQLGDHDVIAPSALAKEEPAYYPSAPSVTVQLIANIGHCFNLHLNNQNSWKGIAGWLKSSPF